MERKILIVEDTEDDLLIMKRYLKEAGYSNIITAENVAEGVKQALDEKPDLVITDTLLPDGNGFEVCQEIKTRLGLGSPKIIVTTGSIDAVDAVKARRAGRTQSNLRTHFRQWPSTLGLKWRNSAT